MAFLTLFRVATGDNWNGIMKVRFPPNSSVFLFLTSGDIHIQDHDSLSIPCRDMSVTVAGHFARQVRLRLRLRKKLLRLAGDRPVVFCHLRTDGSVCPCQRGRRRAHEAS